MNDGRPPPDHVVDEADPDDVDEVREAALGDNFKSKSTWLRLLFMVLFVVLWSVSRLVVFVVVVLQFLWVLVTGATNARLLAFGLSLATYSFQIIAYLTYNTESQPFPFSDWPSGAPGSEPKPAAEDGASDTPND